MMTAGNYLEQVVLERVSLINGLNIETTETEEALITMIAKRVLENSRVNTLLEKHGVIAYNVDSSELKEIERCKDNGVYVYCSNSIIDWTFNKHDTIDDAVRDAVKRINAYIILNGEIIKYDALDDNTAYYYDKENNMRLVRL